MATCFLRYGKIDNTHVTCSLSYKFILVVIQVDGKIDNTIGLNRPALGGTVLKSTTMSRRPALQTFCHAFINHPVLGGTSLTRM